MLKTLITTTLSLQLIGGASLFAQTTAQERKDQRDSFLQMNREIFARHEDAGRRKRPRAGSGESIEAKLRAAIHGAIGQALRAPNPTASDDGRGTRSPGRDDIWA